MTDVTAQQFQTDVNDVSEWNNGDINHTQTFRLGQTADSPAKLINDINTRGNAAIDELNRSRGYRVVGTFASGFTYELPNDVGIDASGNSWIFTNSANLPFTVPAGTTPANPVYEQVTYSDHSALTNRNVSGAHEATAIRINTNESVGSYLSDRNSIKMLGGNGDGATDNSTAFATDTDYIDVAGGVFYINSDTTITADLYIKPNARIVANNCNVTLSCDIVAGNHRIFEEIGTGRFLLSQTSRMDEIRAHWYGVTTNDSTALVADNNARAFALSARLAGSLGNPTGLFRSKVMRIPSGLTYVDDYDSDGIMCPVPTYVSVMGYGDNSAVSPIPNAKTQDLFAVTDAGANSVVIDHFQIDGDASQQTNAVNGIVFRPTGGAAIYCKVGGGIYIREMSGWAFRSTGSGMQDCEVKPRLLRDSTLGNVYMSAFINSVFDSKVRSAKSGANGLLAETANVRDSTFRGEYDENNGVNFFLSNVGARNEIDIKSSTSFQNDNVFLDRVPDAVITKIFTESANQRGLVINQCENMSGGNITARSNGRSGIECYGIMDCNLEGVNSYDNGTSANNTYQNLLIASNSDNNQIDGLMCRGGTGANKVQYNLQINSGCNDNIFGSIDIRGGAVTGDILDNGTNTLGIDIEGSSTWDPTSIPASGTLTFDIAANGAALGDSVNIINFSQPLQGLILNAWVQSANTVRAQLYNPTSGAIDLASGTISVLVDRQYRS